MSIYILEYTDSRTTGVDIAGIGVVIEQYWF